MKLISITNSNDGFYVLLGPFLSRKVIAKELGFPVWDDDGKRWTVALDGESVVGFCAFTVRAGRATFTSDYVLPRFRGHGVYDLLFRKRDELIDGMACVSTATAMSRGTHARHGFGVRARRGRYFVMERGAREQVNG